MTHETSELPPLPEEPELSAAEWLRRCKDMIENPVGKPGRGEVLVARQPRRVKTSGGIYIPSSAKEQSQLGMVIALGEKALNLMGTEIDFYLKPGDTVLVNQYAGKPVHFREVECAVFAENDVVMKLFDSF